SEILKSVSEQYERIIKDAAADIPKFSKGRLEVNLNKLKNFDEILYKDIFKAAVEKCFDVSLNFKNLEDITGLINKEPGAKISIPGKLTAFKERESVVFFDKNKSSDISEVSLGIGEEIKIGSRKISIKQRKKTPGKFTGNRKKEFISGDQIIEKFIVRKWVKSDRFYPIGLRGTKKISDFLNEQKVSLLEKENQLVLTSSGKIVWVVGLRLDERFKVKNNTNRILELCLK
ncbi:MAG: tRNA lysidine(34) synthetase TilS, partial [Ignavibacteriaceae bacterium]